MEHHENQNFAEEEGCHIEYIADDDAAEVIDIDADDNAGKWCAMCISVMCYCLFDDKFLL
jgi:hypothetical protein